MRRVAIAAAAVLCAASAVLGQATESRVATVELFPEGRGVVYQYTSEGRLLRRFVGLTQLSDLSMTGPDRLFDSEPARARALEWDESGKILRTWNLSGRQIYQVTLLPDGNVLLAGGKAGLAEVTPSGKDVWKLPAPAPEAEVVSAARLSDGSVVFIASNVKPPLYRFVPGEASARGWGPPNLESFVDIWVRPRLQVIDRAGSLLALIYQPWDHWFLLRAGKGGSFSADTVRLKTPLSALGGSKKDVWISTQGFDLVRMSLTGQEQTWFATPYVANTIAEAEDGTVFAAFERKLDYVRLAHPPRAGGRGPFPWGRLIAFCVAALAVLAALQGWVWRARERPAESVASAPARDDPPRPIPAGLQRQAIVSIAIGLLLCVWGGARLRSGKASLPYYLAGVAAVVVPAQLLARRRGQRRSRWWEEVLAARVPHWTLAPSAVVMGLVVLGATVLWRWRSSSTHYESSICLWVALILLCIGFALLTERTPRLSAFRIRVETAVHLAILLTLSGLVLFQDLKNIPADYEMDVGFIVDDAVTPSGFSSTAARQAPARRSARPRVPPSGRSSPSAPRPF